VAVGTNRGAVAVNPNTNQIYVANGSNVSVIDGRTNTNTSLTSSLNPSTLNVVVTFTASVTEDYSFSGMPTGTVTFEDNSTTLGIGTLNASGVATFTTGSLTTGQHSITAVYGGDTDNLGSTSVVLNQTVNPNDFAMTSSPTQTTITAGQSVTFTVTVTPQGLFTTPITFSCSGLPALADCAFNPASVTPNASTVTSTLKITTTAPTASLALPSFRHRSSPRYAMWLVLPAMLLGTLAPKRRRLLSYGIVLVLAGGCLLQVACGGGSSAGVVGSSGGTPSGSYTITVTGAASSIQHTTTVQLTVQ